MGKEVRVRMAPSPTGFIHVGSIYTSLFNYVFAKKHRGKFILRIEDTDRRRLVEGAEEAVYEGFDWVGLLPDESPRKPGKYGPYRQSERLKLYRQYAEELLEKEAAYYCFCSINRLTRMRNEQREKGLPPKYDRRCLNLPEDEIKKKLEIGEPKVIRLMVPSSGKIRFTDLIRGKIEFDANDVDDQVLLKSDGFPTYHLAVVVDDHLMGITHIIRGEEWISSVPKHLLIYKALGWQPPEQAHLPLIRTPDRSKLSKRHGHASLNWYKKEGYLPEALLNFLALLGWSHPDEKEVFSLSEMIEKFEFSRFSKTGPIFNLEKLDWMNGVYIRQMETRALAGRIVDYLKVFKKDSIVLQSDEVYIEKVVALDKERLKKLSEFEKRSKFFFTEEVAISPKELLPSRKDKSRAVYILKQSKKLLEVEIEKWNTANLEKKLRAFLTEIPDWTKKELFMMLRVAATGKTATPPLFETLEVLGKEKTIQRLDKVITYLKD